MNAQCNKYVFRAKIFTNVVIYYDIILTFIKA